MSFDDANVDANLDAPIRRPGPRTGMPRPPGAGRKKGTPNRVTVTIRTAALKKGPAMFRALCRLAVESKDEKVRLAAMKEVLDRAYGRSVAPTEVTGADGAPLIPAPAMEDRELARLLCFQLTKAAKDHGGEELAPAKRPQRTLEEAALAEHAEARAAQAAQPPDPPPAPPSNVVYFDERGKAHVPDERGNVPTAGPLGLGLRSTPPSVVTRRPS